MVGTLRKVRPVMNRKRDATPPGFSYRKWNIRVMKGFQ